jgi:hypothetical protein
MTRPGYNGRFTLQVFPPPNKEDEEFYLAGRAEIVDDPEVWKAARAATKFDLLSLALHRRKQAVCFGLDHQCRQVFHFQHAALAAKMQVVIDGGSRHVWDYSLAL